MKVLPDHLLLPISTVSLSSDQDDSRSLDLIELTLLLQEHQHIFPVIQADTEAVFPDTQVQSLFYDQIVAAQQKEPETKAIVKKLLDPAKREVVNFACFTWYRMGFWAFVTQKVTFGLLFLWGRSKHRSVDSFTMKLVILGCNHCNAHCKR